jgi:hypothetical protein
MSANNCSYSKEKKNEFQFFEVCDYQQTMWGIGNNHIHLRSFHIH